MRHEDKIEELRLMLDKIRSTLLDWADESQAGSWSTHQVEPQRKLAVKIQRLLDRTK